MKSNWMVVLLAVVMVLVLTACGAGKEMTLTGMVVSVDGSKISVMEMDMSNMSGMDFLDGQQPQMPGGMGGFPGFGSFDPEDFAGSFPSDGSFPQWDGR